MKVLLVRFSSLGDVALVSSPVELLHAYGHEPWLLTFRPYGELFANDRRVNVIEVERNGGIGNALRKLKGGFGAAFDLHGKLLSGMVVAMSGARIKARYKKRILQRRAAVWFKRRPRFIPVHELYCRPIKNSLKIPGACPLPRLIPPDNGPDLPEKFVILAPGAQHPMRSWPWFPELAELLSARGTDILWIGLGGEGPSDVPGIDLRGKTSIQELLYVISKAKALVSGDTGPMHIARCLGVPVVAIFGPTIPEFGFGPLPGQGIVLEKNLRCRPCSLHGERRCPHALECLTGINPQTVLQSLGVVLGERI
ncbi:MAG: glycosyltransferase family 9 protein [candidate division WOR-3 bacterium]